MPLEAIRKNLRRRWTIHVAIGLHGLAKVCKLADHAIFSALTIISGHTIKHLLAVGAAALVVAYLAPTGVRTSQSSGEEH